MFDFFSSLAIIALEVSCCKFFFETFFEAEEGKKKNIYIIMQMLSTCLWSLSSYFSAHMVQKQIMVIISMTVFMSLYFRESIKKILVFSMLYQSLLLAMDGVIYVVYIFLFPSEAFTKEIYMLEALILILLGKMLLFLCCLFIRKKIWEGKAENLPEAEWVRFMFFPVFTIIANIVMFSNLRTLENIKLMVTMFGVSFGMVAMNIVVFYMLNDVIKREAILHQKNLFEVQGKSQSEMYQSLSENYRRQQEKSHEYLNQMTCIRNLLQNKEYMELEQYVEKISGKMEEGHNLINANHAVINAIINTKYREAERKGIVFVFKINDLLNFGIDDEDIVIILSNLLNNAIEACEKCEGRKVIKLKIIKEENEVIISVKNTYHQPVVFRNNQFITSKRLNSIEHGIGIKNVIQAVEKNCGFYNINYENREFYFSIVIPTAN